MEKSAASMAKMLFRQDLKYSDVIGAFLSLSVNEREQIAHVHGSFVDWLTSSSNELPADAAREFESVIQTTIKDKVRLGIDAFGCSSLSNIHSWLARAPGFVSRKQLTEIVRRFSEFKIVSSAAGQSEVGLSPVEKSQTAQPASSESRSTRRTQAMLRSMYRSYPEVIVALTPAVTWALLLKAHVVWRTYCDHSESTLVGWLLSMAECKSKQEFDEYQQALALCIVRRALDVIQVKPRTVPQLTEFLNISHSNLVSRHFVLKSFTENQELVCVELGESMYKAKVSMRSMKTAATSELRRDQTLESFPVVDDDEIRASSPPKAKRKKKRKKTKQDKRLRSEFAEDTALADCVKGSSDVGSCGEESETLDQCANVIKQQLRLTESGSASEQRRVALGCAKNAVFLDVVGVDRKVAACAKASPAEDLFGGSKCVDHVPVAIAADSRPSAASIEEPESSSRGFDWSRRAFDSVSVNEASSGCDIRRVVKNTSNDETTPESNPAHFTSEEPNPAVPAEDAELAVACSAFNAACDNAFTDCKLEVPAHAAATLSSLLTEKVSCSDLLSSFLALRTTEQVFIERAVSRHDCFLEFLVSYAAQIKPQHFSLPSFRSCLQNQFKIFMCQKLFANEYRRLRLDALYEMVECRGFCNRSFFLETLGTYADRFLLTGGFVTLINEKRCLAVDERSAPPRDDDARENLRAVCFLPHIRFLVSRNPTFDEILSGFHLMSDKAFRHVRAQGWSFIDLIDMAIRLLHAQEYFVKRKQLLSCLVKEFCKHAYSQRRVNLREMVRLVSRGADGLINKSNLEACIKASPVIFKKLSSDEIELVHCPGSLLLPSHQTNPFPNDLNQLTLQLGTALRGSRGFPALLELWRSLPPPLIVEIFGKYGSLRGFIAGSVPEWPLFNDIVRDHVRTILGDKTMFAGELLSALGGADVPLVTPEDLVEILAKGDQRCLFVDCRGMDSLICVQRLGDDGLPMFFNDYEKETVLSVLKLFESFRGFMLMKVMFNTVWHSIALSDVQRTFLFGRVPEECSDVFALHRAHFHRFLLMFPTVFMVVGGDSVLINRNARRGLAPVCEKATVDSGKPDSESEAESGELSSGGVHERSHRARKRSHSDPDQDSGAEEKSRKSKRRHKHRKKHSSHRRGGNKPRHRPSDACAFPHDNLIRDVCMGRLLVAKDGEMDLDELVESLGSSVVDRDLRDSLKHDEDLLKEFRQKVAGALATVDKLRMAEPDQTGLCKIKLNLKASTEAEAPDNAPAPVFRKMSLLTGVSTAKLQSYIGSVACLHDKPIALEILFTLVRQRFEAKKAFSSTSDDVLLCQVVSLLKSDPDFVMNPADQTFCLAANYQGKLPCAKSYLSDVGDEEVSQFIVDCLKEHGSGDGASIRELTDKVLTQFQKRIPSVPKAEVALAVQGLIGEIPRVGFALSGHVMLLLGKAQENSNLSATGYESEAKRDEATSEEPRPGSSEAKQAAGPTENPTTSRSKRTTSFQALLNIIQTNKTGRDVNPTERVADVRGSDLSGDTTSTSDLISSSLDSERCASNLAAKSRVAPNESVGESRKPFVSGVDWKDCNSNYRPLNNCPVPVGVKKEQQQVLAHADLHQQKRLMDNSERAPPAKPVDRCVSDSDISSTSVEPSTFQFPNQAPVTASKRSGSQYGRPAEGPYPDTHVSSTSACDPSAPSLENSARERSRKIGEFARWYLSSRNLRAQTSHLLEAAYQRFAAKRFARSRLALEAYVLEHLAASGHQFGFGNRFGGPGASWVFYRPQQYASTPENAINLPHAEFLPEIVHLCRSHLQRAPQKKQDLKVLAQAVMDSVGPKMLQLEKEELPCVCRCLVLIGCLKNLEFFVFIRSQPEICLRGVPPTIHPGPMPRHTPTFPPPPTRKADPRSATNEALLLIADIIRNRGPITKTELRDIWSAEARKDLRKVLGTGVSFALSFRKFESCFPASANGILCVNDKCLERFLKST